MAVKSVGNIGAPFSNHGSRGISARSFPTGMGYASWVNNKADDYVIVLLSSIVTGDINQGIFVQASKAVTVELTLSNPGVADNSNPDTMNEAMWDAPITLTPNQIKELPSVFTAMRITFPEAGTEVCVGVR